MRSWKARRLKQSRKAEKLDLRRDVVAEYLGLDRAGAEGLRMLPVVVTAHGYGFSTRVDDVLVVEAEYLRLYLMGDDLITRSGTRCRNRATLRRQYLALF